MPGNDLIPVSDLTDDDRLQDTVFTDTLRELLQRFFIKAAARLVAVGFDL